MPLNMFGTLWNNMAQLSEKMIILDPAWLSFVCKFCLCVHDFHRKDRSDVYKPGTILKRNFV